MADNLQLPVMAGGEVIKADDMTTYKIEGVKLVVGADGVDGGYVSDANPLPVESTSTVIGSVLPAGAATEDSLLDILAALVGTLSVGGTVAVSNFPSNFAVNNFPSGFLAAQSGAWTVGVSNFPATQPVSDGGASLTVDGTVAATQSGTWNVGTVASITNPVAVTGTFYQATQPVSLASVPSHPVTNAGTFAVQVSSIAAGDNNIGNVDIVSMPAIPAGANVIGGVTQSGTWNVGTVTAVTGITNPVAITDNSGSLTVDAPVGTPAFVRLSDGAAPISTLPVSLASVPSHAVTLPNVHFQDVAITGALTTTLNNNVVLSSAGTGTIDLLNGTVGNSFKTITLQITPAAGTVTAGAISFEGSNDGTNFFIVPLYDVTNPVAGSITTYSVVAGTSRMFSGPVPARYFRARISTGITGTTTGVVCETKLSTGPFVSSQAFITVAPSSNNIGDVDVLTIAAGANLIGDVGLQARTTGGSTPYRSIDVDETKYQVKGSAGSLISIFAMNMTASVLYLHVYDQVSASVTVGTTTPAFTFPLPTNADTNGCGFVCNFGLPGAVFAAGITMAVTTTVGGTTGPAANAVFVNGLYK